ncbi:MAG TPA: serine hydrolase domain-containing protein [Anaerolineales bacterium]|nr:serine hydrolase domain-containing protein [Anaerolineales bacterium]
MKVNGIIWLGEIAQWATRLVFSAALVFAVTIVTRAAETVGASPRADTPDFAAIDRYIEKEMQVTRLPGLALGIVHGDQIVHLKGFGVADPSGRAVTPQTPFHLASIGKSFTALAIMQLVEAGQVELDAPVQRYLPWFRVADADAAARITVRHLLNQTSGISSASSLDISAQNFTGEQAIEQSVRALATAELNRPVGESYEYANMNYVTLGLIVQTVSGQPYAEYIQQQIFLPLEMSAAYLDSSQDRERGAAVGHAYWFGFPRPAPMLQFPGDQPAGADSFSAGAEDMSHYLIAQLNGGRYGEQNLLSPEGIVTLHEPASPTGAPDSFYGMGWVKGVITGVPVVHHDGGLPGFLSYMALAPANRWGVVVLTNGEASLNVRTSAIGYGVVSLLHRQQPAPPPDDDRWLVYTVLLVVAVIQAAGMMHTLSVIRRWRIQPERRPAGRGTMLWHIGLPLAINLAWGIAILIVLPSLVSIPRRILAASFPDVNMILTLSAMVALAWSILRTAMALNALGATHANCVTRAQTA